MTEKNQIEETQSNQRISEGEASALLEQLREYNRISSKDQQMELEQAEKVEHTENDRFRSSQQEDSIEESDEIYETIDKTSKITMSSISQIFVLKSVPIFVLIFICAALSLYFIGPWSKEKEITIVGNVHLSTDDIIQYSLISEKDYVLTTFFHMGEVEQNIKNGSNLIESDNIQYEFPNRFKITIKEYTEIGYVKENGTYRAVLSSGDIMEMFSEALPESATIINLQDKELIKKLAVQLGKIDTSILSAIRTVDLTPSKATTDLLTLTMEDENKILVPLSEIDEKLPYYAKIAPQLSVPSTVDMEVGIFSYSNG